MGIGFSHKFLLEGIEKIGKVPSACPAPAGSVSAEFVSRSAGNSWDNTTKTDTKCMAMVVPLKAFKDGRATGTRLARDNKGLPIHKGMKARIEGCIVKAGPKSSRKFWHPDPDVLAALPKPVETRNVKWTITISQTLASLSLLQSGFGLLTKIFGFRNVKNALYKLLQEGNTTALNQAFNMDGISSSGAWSFAKWATSGIGTVEEQADAFPEEKKPLPDNAKTNKNFMSGAAVKSVSDLGKFFSHYSTYLKKASKKVDDDNKGSAVNYDKPTNTVVNWLKKKKDWLVKKGKELKNGAT